MDIFSRELYLPSDGKMNDEEQDRSLRSIVLALNNKN